MWESIQKDYESKINGNTGKTNNSKESRKNIEPFLHNFFEAQKAFLEPFAAIVFTKY